VLACVCMEKNSNTCVRLCGAHERDGQKRFCTEILSSSVQGSLMWVNVCMSYYL
jgi:hypothetical protein